MEIIVYQQILILIKNLRYKKNIIYQSYDYK